MQTPNLNGLQVYQNKTVGNTLFVPLPRALWRKAGDGPCSCSTCSARKSPVAYWDTLALAAKGSDYTWMVHYPELHSPQPDQTDDGQEVNVIQFFRLFPQGARVPCGDPWKVWTTSKVWEKIRGGATI